MSTNIAIIPVRTGSKRLRNKNTLDFFGKPMFMHTVEAAKKSGLFDEIHVSTESQEVVEICVENDLSVRFLRDQNLASDEASLESVCLFVLDKYKNQYDLEFDNFCLLWATAPLRTSKDVIQSYELMTKEVDAIVSATTYDLPVFCAQEIDSNGFLVPIFPDMFWLPSQKMPKVYCDNGALCWVRVDAFLNEGIWMPKKSKPYIMDKSRSVDIDTKEDLNMAKYLFSQMKFSD
jgi:CMP-N-acetylneuraminic acid synthetase